MDKEDVVKLINAAINTNGENFIESDDYKKSETGTRNLRGGVKLSF
jgi:hypothetical protein